MGPGTRHSGSRSKRTPQTIDPLQHLPLASKLQLLTAGGEVLHRQPGRAASAVAFALAFADEADQAQVGMTQLQYRSRHRGRRTLGRPQPARLAEAHSRWGHSGLAPALGAGHQGQAQALGSVVGSGIGPGGPAQQRDPESCSAA